MSDAAPTTLDKLISDAVQGAREQAVKATMDAITGGGALNDSAIMAEIRAEVVRLVRDDEQVKQMIRDAMVRALTAPPRRW